MFVLQLTCNSKRKNMDFWTSDNGVTVTNSDIFLIFQKLFFIYPGSVRINLRDWLIAIR